MPKNIVLAHGILGFGMIPVVSNFVNYFNGVEKHLNDQHHCVFTSSVDPIGSVEFRGKRLAEEIMDVWPGEEEIHIIAHSMGGLDARSALANNEALRERVKTLVMIGTPNRGSLVADAIFDPTNKVFQPLLDSIPAPLRIWLQDRSGALEDLTTQKATAFDDSHRSRMGVRYIEVAGNAFLASNGLFPGILVQEIANLTGGDVNDGVVTRSSALCDGDDHLEDWPVDHAGEIGWTLLSPPAELPIIRPPHFARYDDIVALL